MPVPKLKNPYAPKRSKRETRVSIKPTRVIGEGREAIVSAVIVKGKNGAKLAAQRMFRVGSLQHFKAREKLVHAKRIWFLLRNAGLPVPAFFTPILRKKSKNHLTLLSENLEHKYGKLFDGHNRRGKATFFKTLSARKDALLIKQLASDLAKMNSLGLSVPVLDVWAYYKKGNSFGRVIIDFEFVLEDKSREDFNGNLETQFSELRTMFGKDEFNLFKKEYFRLAKESTAVDVKNILKPYEF
ncbi:MAG: hypothetical protein WCW13_05520 [archaeon]|jgi:hypothetical protein